MSYDHMHSYFFIYRILLCVAFSCEVRNSRFAKLSYEIELHKMTSHFDLLARTFLEILLSIY